MTRKIDTVANEAINEHATPGLVVMVVKSGRVLLEKSYGFHTYDNKEKPKRVIFSISLRFPKFLRRHR